MKIDIKKEIEKSSWITAPKEYEAPVIMREFTISDVKTAKIALSSLGNFILYINGNRIGNEYFLPSNSIFCARDAKQFFYPIKDEFTYRCYYSIYDIEKYIIDGENLIEIALGNGWYRQNERIAEGNVAFGDSLGAIYTLVFEDKNGTTVLHSDGNEICRTSNTVKSSLFYGEIYDSRITEYAVSAVAIKKLPDTVLTFDDAPADRVIREIKPKLIYEEGNRRLYDAGENISGFVTVLTDAADGERVTIRFADEVRNNEFFFVGLGTNYKSPAGIPQIMEDVFIGNGGKHIFEPKFLWHAFRYFEIVGNAEPLAVKVIHSDVTVTSDFESSSEELNWLYKAYVRTQTDNMHQGVPLDCPHRERLGYTGDGQVCAPAAMLMLDARSFYKKWIRDIFDSQDKKTGHINHTAPFAGGGGGPGGWGMAAITVPYNYYKIYGDFEPIKENYLSIKKWIEYLVVRCENGLIVREEDGGWCLGDWSSIDKMQLDPPFVNTCLFIRALKFAEVFANKMGIKKDAEYFRNLSRVSSKAVIDKYYDETTGSFAGKKQGADAFAIASGLGDSLTINNVKEFYRNLGYFDTGFLGTDLLTEALFENKGEDIAFDLLSTHSVGGFGYCMEKGATTIWENWNGTNSRNHPMFGGCSRMLFTGILGINQETDSYGFEKIIISPKIPEKMHFAKGYITIKEGKISVKLERKDEFIHINIELPENVYGKLIYRENKYDLCEANSSFKFPIK